MRVALLSLDFGLILLTLVTLLHTQGTTALPENSCPTNCVSSEKCDWPIARRICDKSGDVCCSILKTEYRTECRHHGGECMDSCNESLTRTVNDCPPSTQCCILV